MVRMKALGMAWLRGALMLACVLAGLGLPAESSAQASMNKESCYVSTTRERTILQRGMSGNVDVYVASNNHSTRLVDAQRILEAVLNNIHQLTQNAWQNSYNTLLMSTGFQNTVAATILLYLTVFGVMIVFGMTNLTWYEVFLRVFKIAFVVALLTVGGGLGIFQDFIARFFVDGMNGIIAQFATITGRLQTPGNSPVPISVAPLNFLIEPLELVFDMRFLGSIMALPLAGVAGFGLCLFILYGTFFFILSSFAAVATYIKALIGLSIMFGLAPIFIPCILFEQTRRLFDGWLTLVVSFALQPIFTFAFLGFFMVMIVGVLRPLLEMSVCWGLLYEVLFIRISWWYPMNTANFAAYAPAQHPGLSADLWSLARLHVHVVDALMFAMLASLSWRYSSYVEQIARELAGGSVTIGTTAAQLGEQLRKNNLDPMSLVGRAKDTVMETGSGIRNMIAGNRSDASTSVREMMNPGPRQ